MHINPILENEMKRNMRSVRISWIIFLVNFILAVIGITAYFGGGGKERYLTAGQYFSPMKTYVMMSYVLFVMICLIVPGIAGSSITLERERKTLDLLLVTYLSPWKIVAGKLESVLGMVFLIAISALPVLSLVMVYGGITITDLMLLVMIIVVSGVFIGSISVFCSAAAKKTVTAVICSYGITIFLTIGILILLLWGGPSFMESMAEPVSETFNSMRLWTWAVLILLCFNPLSVYYGLLNWQTGNGHLFLQGSGLAAGGAEKFVMKNILVISVVVQCVFSILLLYEAGRMIRIRENGKR